MRDPEEINAPDYNQIHPALEWPSRAQNRPRYLDGSLARINFRYYFFFKSASNVCQQYHWYQQETFTPPPLKLDNNLDNNCRF